jgi:hypothetical protein
MGRWFVEMPGGSMTVPPIQPRRTDLRTGPFDWRGLGSSHGRAPVIGSAPLGSRTLQLLLRVDREPEPRLLVGVRLSP